MSKKDKKVSVISPVQLALFSAIGGHIVNTILKKVEHNAEVERQRDMTVDPNSTVVSRGRRKSLEPADINYAAEEFVLDNCPYIESTEDTAVRYYITQSVNIGRYPHNDIQLHDNTVSRVHCRIYVNKGKYYLIDMGASTPAEVNGKAVDNSRPATVDGLFTFELEDGDKIKIGGNSFVFRKPEVKDRDYNSTMSSCESTVILD